MAEVMTAAVEAAPATAAGGDIKGDTTTLEDLSVLAKLRSDED